MSRIRAAWRSTLGWERRRLLLDWVTGDRAPAWRRHEYKRRFGRGLIRALTAADSPPWCRVVMNQETRRLIEELGPGRLDVLEVSGDKWKDAGFRSYRQVDYPEYDLCAGPLEATFDLVIAEQVFEHLLWPYRAGRNAFAMVRPGGHLHVSTPFLFPIHGAPTDCTRWTETGLKHFLAECGFPIESCVTGSWGNRACVTSYLKGPARYRRWRHSLRNEPATPIVVWALARRP